MKAAQSIAKNLKHLSLIERALLSLAIVVGGVMFFFTVQFLSSLLVIVVLSIAGNDSDAISRLIDDSSGLQFAFSLMTASLMASGIYYGIKLLGWKPLTFLKLQKRPTGGQIFEVFTTYGIYFLTLIIATIVVGELTTIDTQQTQDLGAVAREGWGLVGTFISLVVLAPIVEELLFRGVLFRSLRAVGGRIAAYVLVSILFGAAHLEFDNLNYIAAIDTLIFSGFLIYLYEKHDTLYSPIILHAVKNCIAFIALFIII